jgi:hypothetical protein
MLWRSESDAEFKKSSPRSGHDGLEGEQWYNCTLSLTSALDEDGGYAVAQLVEALR